MKRYRDLNLAVIRDKNELDFAHYTYPRGKGIFDYLPFDFPKIFWRNEEIIYFDYSYILFKNTDTLDGHKIKKDFIEGGTMIAFRFRSDEQANNVIADLQQQLGNEYKVVMPEIVGNCIEIRLMK